MSRLSYYPLFRVDLVQMFRHGEVKQAIKLAAKEFQLARKANANSSKGSGGGQDSGVIMVPTPSRAYQMGYAQQPRENDDLHYGASMEMSI